MELYTVLREKLIQIPFFSKLGMMRRELCARKEKSTGVDIELIKEKYKIGKNLTSNKYFIVYEDQPQGGLFVYLIGCMVQIAYAMQKDYIPVVDMLNFPTNLKNKEQTDINAWELYFKQPSGVSVQDVYGAENIIFHGEEDYSILFIGDVDENIHHEEYQVIIDEGKEFKEWYSDVILMKQFQDFWKKYMCYSDETRAYIEQWYQKLFMHGKRVLGLLCRGTDYISLKPKGHYVQPSVEMILPKVEEIMRKYRCEFVFLATEDANIFLKLKEKLGSKLLSMDVERVHYKEGYLLKDLYSKQRMDVFQRQLDYLTEMELLARCECLIAGKTTGSRFLPVMKEGEYEYLFYWELGRY